MVEAVVESLEVKKQIFRELEAIVAPEAILATNTSSLSVTEISTANAHPGRVIGVHFFNPAPVQNLVEIIRTVVTEPAGARGRDGAGAGRSARTPSSAATRPASSPTRCSSATSTTRSSMYEGKYASREDIDAAMRFGCGYPMGPLQLLDLIGLDTAYEILETMYRQGRDRLHAPAPILKQMVTAGHARPQDRPRLLHLRAARTARSSWPTTARRPADDQPQLQHDIAPSASSAPAPWPAASSRSSPRPGTTCCSSAAAQDKVDGVRRHDHPELRQGRSSAAGPPRTTRPRCSAGSPAPPRSTTSSDVDIVVEAIAEDLAIKTTLFENLDDICKPGAILATTTSSLPVIALATGHRAAAGRHRHALLQPGAGDEAGRGRLHRR